ncbi:MAG TPA: hypothetical protein GX707_15020 [Epulopiscium sp.]|nr:hypothetical protein [Candidatus Epulonipiscium sp.]
MDIDLRIKRCIEEFDIIINSPNRALIMEEMLYFSDTNNIHDLNEKRNSSRHYLGTIIMNDINSAMEEASKKLTLGEHLQRIVKDRIESGKFKKESNIYNKACINKDYWCKLTSDSYKDPSNKKLFAIAIVLELSLKEVLMLLEKNGSIFKDSDDFDVMFSRLFDNKVYNTTKIDELLEQKNFEPMFSSK